MQDSATPTISQRPQLGFFITVLMLWLMPSAFAEKDLHQPKALRSLRGSPVQIYSQQTGIAPIVLMKDAQHKKFIKDTVGELVECLTEATGQRPEVLHNDIPQGPAIIIGEGPLSREAGIDVNQLPHEGFVIRTHGNKLLLVGRYRYEGKKIKYNYNANHHAVTAFLERYVGVRWYWPKQQGGRSILQQKSISVPSIHLMDAPHFRMRTIWPPFENKPEKIDHKYLYALLGIGNSWENTIQCHTPHWERNTKYTKDHPEVFMLRADGSRAHHMMCYSHPKTMKFYLEEIDTLIKRGKDMTYHERKNMVNVSGKSITVSPADMKVVCRCEYCKPQYQPEQGQFGSASTLMGRFVRDLALEVKKRWPDHTVTFLPYLNYTLAPKELSFPDNVEVELCGMPGLALYKEPSINERFQRNIDDWAKLTGRKAHTWEYSCWPADRTKANYQYPHVLKTYYQHNRDKLVGSFINGVGGEWIRFNATMYCWVKLLWNPDYDVDAMMEVYSKRMFGKAEPVILELLKLQCKVWESNIWNKDDISMKSVYGESFTPEVVQNMKDLVNKAKAAVQGDEISSQRLDYFLYSFKDFFSEADSVHSGKGITTLVAQKVGDTPIIDGKLNDEAWQECKGLMFQTKEHAKPTRYPTEVKAVWTLDGVCFAFDMLEPDTDQLVRNLKGHDEGSAWFNDNVEIFLDVSGKNDGHFYQWIINANKAIWDGISKNSSWNSSKNVRVGVDIQKGRWSMEVYLPFDEFPNVSHPVKSTGVTWPAQFTRHRMSSGTVPKGQKQDKNNRTEYSRMNHRFGGPSANTGDFGLIRFQE